MKKIRRILIIILLALIVIGSSFFALYKLLVDENALSIKEKKWIDENNSNVISLSIPNDLPVFGNTGAGVFFDFSKYLTDNLGLKINNNTVSYLSDTTGYGFKVTEKGDSVLVEYSMELPEGITTYDENNLSKVVVPEVTQGKAVYLSGRGPNYLTVAIAEAYAHTNSSVSLFQPGVGYTCSITHSRNKRLGDLTKDPLGKEKIKEQLAESKENLIQKETTEKTQGGPSLD